MLAGHLGKTVGELQDTMSALEFAEWAAYHRVNPIGEYREDWRAGVVASTVANVNRGKGTPPFQPSDFMPQPPETEKQKVARMKAALRSAAKTPKVRR